MASPKLPGIVVCAGADAPVSALAMLARTGGVTVPVVLGAVPAARRCLTFPGTPSDAVPGVTGHSAA